MTENNKILTVSVAAYNVEKTIRQCLDSFLPSKFFDKLEVIVVNDGSSDSTETIVKEYADKYPDTIILLNKENGGWGSTVNASVEAGHGLYFKLIDGDDWVDTAELDNLMAFLKITDADLIIDDFMLVYPYKRKRKVYHDKYKYTLRRTYTYQEFDQISKLDNMIAMHATTIRLQALRDVKMKIQEHCFYTDNEFGFYAGLAANTIAFNDSCVYQYRLGVEGQSVSSSGLYKHISDALQMERKLIDTYDQIEADIVNQVKKRYLFAIVNTRYNWIIWLFMDIIKQSDKDYLLID